MLIPLAVFAISIRSFFRALELWRQRNGGIFLRALVLNLIIKGLFGGTVLYSMASVWKRQDLVPSDSHWSYVAGVVILTLDWWFNLDVVLPRVKK